MNKNKTLKELGEEYASYIKLNDENISSVKMKLKSAREKGESLNALELERTLAVLYEISRELRENSEHLNKYYDKKMTLDIVC